MFFPLSLAEPPTDSIAAVAAARRDAGQYPLEDLAFVCGTDLVHDPSDVRIASGVATTNLDRDGPAVPPDHASVDR